MSAPRTCAREASTVFRTIREDIRTVFAKDPAAKSTLEVLVAYPGLHALWLHRVANFLWRHRMRLAARMTSHFGRFLTAIEIHPGATIGRRFFIDHGSGVVIGETADIGNDVLMYQGVVLGGTTLEKGKRHPTIRDHVVLGAGSIVLGPIVVEEGARIGAGSVVNRPVPAGSSVVGVPGRAVTRRAESVADLEHGDLPDPVAEALRQMTARQEQLRDRLARMEDALRSGDPGALDAAEGEDEEPPTRPSDGAGG